MRQIFHDGQNKAICLILEYISKSAITHEEDSYWNWKYDS